MVSKTETYEQITKRLERERIEKKKQAEIQHRANYVAGLRALADAIESRPNMPVPEYGYTVDINVTASEYKWIPATETSESKSESKYDNDETIRRLKAGTRAIPGKKDKKFLDYAFVVEKEFSPNVKYKLTASRKAVCKAVPTGNKIIHAAYQPPYVPERVEEEIEWVCEDAAILTK